MHISPKILSQPKGWTRRWHKDQEGKILEKMQAFNRVTESWIFVLPQSSCVNPQKNILFLFVLVSFFSKVKIMSGPTYRDSVKNNLVMSIRCL